MKKIILNIMIFMAFCSTIYAYAAMPNNDREFVLQVIDDLNAEIESEGSTVDEEINSLKLYYEEIKTKENEQQINSLLDGINQLNNISRSVFDPIHIASVKACLAYFNLKGYKLSAELLNFAFANQNIDTIYHPIHSNVLFHTEKYRELAYGNIINGIDSFEDMKEIYDIDSHYAIRHFNFTKQSAQSLSVSIFDTYDYAKDEKYDSPIVSAAVNAMYYAQEDGVIVPFKIEIVGETPHSKSYKPHNFFNYHIVFCTRCKLNYGESHEFIMKNISEKNHTEKCKYCLTERTRDHVLKYKSNTSEDHTLACVCGYESVAPHIYSAASPFDLNYHSYSCSVCSQVKYEEHNWVIPQKPYNYYALPRYYICNICGLAKDTH